MNWWRVPGVHEQMFAIFSIAFNWRRQASHFFSRSISIIEDFNRIVHIICITRVHHFHSPFILFSLTNSQSQFSICCLLGFIKFPFLWLFQSQHTSAPVAQQKTSSFKYLNCCTDHYHIHSKTLSPIWNSIRAIRAHDAENILFPHKFKLKHIHLERYNNRHVDDRRDATENG